MAHVDQTKKAIIAAALKIAMPEGWKYTLAVTNQTALTLTIKSAPIDLIGLTRNKHNPENFKGYTSINTHWLDDAYEGDVLVVMEEILGALNTDNYYNTDVMTDYYDVGH